MKEEWKDIKGYEGLYQVSNLGRVKSLERETIIGKNRIVHQKEKIMKYTTRSGYYNLVLRKNGKRTSKQVHRLVAEAFIPNPTNLSIVNHIDYNRKNNVVSNLEWCTQKENVEWSKCHMHGRRNVNYSNTKERYISYRKSTNKYRIIIDKKEYKNCDTLEEAIKKRDEILNEKI